MFNNLKLCRESLEMTQSDLGNIFNLSKQTISNWENGNDTIPLLKLVHFCNLYNFSMDYVTGLTKKNTLYKNKIKINRKELGNNLKELRKQSKLKQKDIALECGISQTTYSNYELGITLITTLSLYSFCKFFNVSIDWILGRSEEKYIKNNN